MYLPVEAPRNVNTLDRRDLVELARLLADPPGQPALLDPEFGAKLQQAISEQTLGGLMTITPQQLAGTVEALGVRIDAAGLSPASGNQFLTDRSYVFRIHATGSAGAVAEAHRRGRELRPHPEPRRAGAGPAAAGDRHGREAQPDPPLARGVRMAQRILGLDLGAHAVKAVLLESTYRGYAVVDRRACRCRRRRRRALRSCRARPTPSASCSRSGDGGRTR